MFQFFTSLFKAAPLPEGTVAELQSIIDSNAVVVFSKSYCPYCTKTKSLLTSLGQNFKLYELNEIPQGSTWQAGLQQLTGQRTVPNVFINGKHIGGNSDVQELHAQGKLTPLFT